MQRKEFHSNIFQMLLTNYSPHPKDDHYSDVIMDAIASQITSLTIVYSTVYSDADQKTPKLRVTGLCVGNSLWFFFQWKQYQVNMWFAMVQ